MPGILATWIGEVALGPYTEAPDAALTKMARPRHVQLVPIKYASLLVHRENISPKQAYQEVAGAIHANGNDAACQIS